jgi:hypothetical protein
MYRGASRKRSRIMLVTRSCGRMEYLAWVFYLDKFSVLSFCDSLDFVISTLTRYSIDSPDRVGSGCSGCYSIE